MARGQLLVFSPYPWRLACVLMLLGPRCLYQPSHGPFFLPLFIALPRPYARFVSAPETEAKT